MGKIMEENGKEAENIRQNEAAKKTFTVIIILSCVVGFLIGVGAVMFSGIGQMDGVGLTEALGAAVTTGLGRIAPFLMTVFFVAALLYAFVGFRQAKKRWELEKDTNDDIYDELDEKLNGILSVVNFYTIISYYLFAVAFYAQTYAEKKSYAAFILALVVYVASIVFISRYQQKVVDFYKIMNPEKQGSVYDVKFQKKWIESCDEAERQAIYRCGFKAYRTASLACVLLWMLFVLMALFLQISLWPVTVTTIFWLILTVSYLWEAHKIGKKGRSETIL